MIIPPPLQLGARIRVVAPSGNLDPTLTFRGLGWLAQHYRVEFDRQMFTAHGYLAGSDERRRAELVTALTEPGIAAVVAARGGYGLGRIAHQLGALALTAAPRWVVGFSDITALHVELAAVGVASLHADHIAGLGRGDAKARARWQEALHHPLHPRHHTRLQSWSGGHATGPCFGGNLTLLGACAAAGRLRVPPGAVLFLEDVAEAPYRLDRTLTSLLVSGALDKVAAVVVGHLPRFESGRGPSCHDVVRERLATLGVPVVAGFPAGHERPNEPIPLGLPIHVDAQRATVTLCPG